jgi:hypothetical protein
LHYPAIVLRLPRRRKNAETVDRWRCLHPVSEDGGDNLTPGHEEHLDDVVAGYGTGVDLDVIRAWWSLRSLQAARWLIEHGFDPSSPGCEFAVLRSRL